MGKHKAKTKQPQKSRRSQSKVKQFSLTLWLIKWGFIASIWAAVTLGLGLVWFGYDLPDLKQLQLSTRRPGISIVTSKGELLATYGDIYGRRVASDALPHYVSQAIIAVEDRHFYTHWGVDILGVLRAAWRNYQAHAVVQGGSTITQQLAKNFLLAEKRYAHTDRSFRRKIQELLLALWLEHTFTKDQILSLYLNRVYLGSGTFGVEAAAAKYFHKAASHLTLYEAAVIAGLLKAPSKYAPTVNPKAADDRAKVVLDCMVDAGFITPTERTNMKIAEERLHSTAGPQAHSRYFTDWIVESIPQLIGTLDKDVIVVTTLDPALQKHAEATIQRTLDDTTSKKMNAQQVALVSMAMDGAIKAMVGGRNYSQSKFNRATQARRQPGSAFKLFVYLAALEKGYTPDSQISDAPLRIGKWRPKNYHWESRGSVDLTTSFAYSINTVSTRLAAAVSPKRIIDVARRLGLQYALPKDLSISLGTGEVTLAQLTAAYGTVANGGWRVVPYGILEIRDRQGRVLYRHKDHIRQTQVLHPTVAQHMDILLRSVVDYGTGKSAALSDKSSAGKTGTSQDYHDAWFIGYTHQPGLITGVWFGNDDNKPMKKVTGGTLPTMVWRGYMMGVR